MFGSDEARRFFERSPSGITDTCCDLTEKAASRDARDRLSRESRLLVAVALDLIRAIERLDPDMARALTGDVLERVESLAGSDEYVELRDVLDALRRLG